MPLHQVSPAEAGRRFALHVISELADGTAGYYIRAVECFEIVCRQSKIPRMHLVRTDHMHEVLQYLETSAAKIGRPWKSKGTRRKYVAALKAFTKYCKGQGYLARDPMEAIALKRVDRRDRRQMVYIEVQNWDEVLEQAGKRHPLERAIMAFLLYTGVRSSEARGMTWRNLSSDLTEAGVYRKKIADIHGFTLLHRATEELRRWKAWVEERYGPTKPNWPVFPVRARDSKRAFSTGMHPEWALDLSRHAGVEAVQEMAKRAAIVAGFDESELEGQAAHITRRSFGVMFMLAGNDLQAVQEQLGHATPTETQVYLGVRDGKRAASELTKRMNAAAIVPDLDDIIPAPKPVSVDVDLDDPEAVLKLIDTPSLLFEVVQRLTPLELITFMAKVTRHIDPERVRWMLELAQEDIRPYSPLALAA